MTLRDARAGELQGTAGKGEFQVVAVEGGKIVGYSACSVIDGIPYLHDLEGTPEAAPAVLKRAFRWLRKKMDEIGATHYLCNVCATAPNVFDMCIKRGEIYNVVFRMEKP